MHCDGMKVFEKLYCKGKSFFTAQAQKLGSDF